MLYTAAGTAASDAVFYTATYFGTGPCALSVSSSGGGFITVADFNHTVLYLAPTGFGVLIDAGYNTTYNINGTGAYESLDFNEVYNVATGVVSQTATNLNQYEASDPRTFLPTSRAVLSIGSVGYHASASSTGGPYINSELFLTAPQTWVSAGTPIGGNTAEIGLVTLFSGDALLVGSFYHYINSTYQYYTSDNQIFSAATRAWSETAPLPVPRTALGISLLRDGRVLASGGAAFSGAAPPENGSYNIADLYNPLAGTWSSESAHLQLHNRPAWRVESHSVCLFHALAGCRSGIEQSGVMRTSGAGTMTRPRSGHVVITLNDGRVLAIAGTGYSSNGIGTTFVDSATTSEVYDPVTNTWSATGTLTMPRMGGFNAVLLPSGRVLVAGGSVDNRQACSKPVGCSQTLTTATTEIWSPSTGNWTRGPDMPTPRQDLGMLTLPTGLVLVTGGFYYNTQPNGLQGATTPLSSDLLFTEQTGAWSATGPLLGPTDPQRAVLIPTGR